VFAAQNLNSSSISKRTSDWLVCSPEMAWLRPPHDVQNPERYHNGTGPEKAIAEQGGSFPPGIKPMIATTIPEMSEKRMALIRMCRIRFFMAFSVRDPKVFFVKWNLIWQNALVGILSRRPGETFRVY